MKKIIKFSSILFFFLLTIGCNNSMNAKYSSNSDTTNFKQLVEKWNNAHSTKDVGIFSNLFDNKVLFYGRQQDKNTCIEGKLSLFKKYPDFYQQIFGDIQIEKLNDSTTKCTFVKRVTFNQKTIDYPSYLTFKKFKDGWKISTESDFVTDKNLSKSDNDKSINNNLQDYSYEPTVSTISGIIKTESFFGRPGYGENPQTDEREDAYILNIENTINVISKAKVIEEGDWDMNYFNISKIHVFSTHNIQIKKFLNKKVRMSGTIMGKSSPHHHADVLLDIQKIEEL